MPLDYSAVEEYHVNLEQDGKYSTGKVWIMNQPEWEIEIKEGMPRLSAEALPENIATPFRQFERLVGVVEAQKVQLRTCGTCAHFRRNPDQAHSEDWIGYCSYQGNDIAAPPLPGQVSLLAADCHLYQAAKESPPFATDEELSYSNPSASDPHETKALPVAQPKKGFFNQVLRLFGLEKEEVIDVRAGVMERPGGQPCPVCGTRMTNRASITNADKRGNERVLSVWRCPHCYGNYLDDWFEAFIGSRARDGERLYVVPPVEANKGAAIVVHCPRPDIKGPQTIANKHFDEWGDALEKIGRRIKHRESVVSL